MRFFIVSVTFAIIALTQALPPGPQVHIAKLQPNPTTNSGDNIGQSPLELSAFTAPKRKGAKKCSPGEKYETNFQFTSFLVRPGQLTV